jgi:tryptophan synthase alpha chain
LLTKPILISYIPAKHPCYSTLELVKLYVASGINAIEFGFPSKNPWLDGPLIKRLHEFMRTSGIDYKNSHEIFSEIRSRVNIPVFLMTYSDVVLAVGERQFLVDCKLSGFSGAIIPDMELDRIEGLMNVRFVDIYKDDLKQLRFDYDLFYLRASKAQTGERPVIDEARLTRAIDYLKSNTNAPVISGFGIETEEDITRMMSFGLDGLAISTSILRALEELPLDLVGRKIRSFSSSLKRSYKIL